MDEIKLNASRWLESPLVSKEDKDIIKSYSKETYDDAFYKSIEFGTAGMRGILGPGSNRMNYFTVRRAAVCFARLLINQYPGQLDRGIVISHDNRHKSREFTLESAKIFNEMGLNAYIFDDLRPTPELSFAVRYLKTLGGVMITASHNPKEYNGYKVYDETGCQLTPAKIFPLLRDISNFPNELEVNYFKAGKPGKTFLLDSKVDDAYVAEVKTISVHPELDKSNFKIVYSPQHGASYENAMRVFKEMGYKVYEVSKQCTHDPDFGGTKSPNPEEPIAYEESIKLAKEVEADLIVMTDPDGDRVGLGYLSNLDHEYHLLNGNQSAALLIYYLLSEKANENKLPLPGILYDTIVTSRLGATIAKSFGVDNLSLLTGFKYIGEAIAKAEKTPGSPNYIFGYEESYGCLPSSFVRDKDGIQAILLYSEMALFFHQKGLDLGQALDLLMEKYGYHYSAQASKKFVGPTGSKAMKELMESLHQNPPTEVGSRKVRRIEDYELLKFKEGDKEGILTLPKSEVVKLIFEDGSWAAIRPSGTEPKVKFYTEVISKSKGDPKALSEEFTKDLLKALKVE